MLTLAVPAALALLGLLAPLVVLYFLRQRFRQHPIASTLIWQRLLQTSDKGAQLRWRSLILLLLQILAVVILVIALAELGLGSRELVRPGVLYLVDTSPSMGALTDEGGQTRLEHARAAILADAAALPKGTPVAILGMDSDLSTDSPVIRRGDHASDLSGDLGNLSLGSAALDEESVARHLAAWLTTDRGAWSAVMVSDGGTVHLGSRLNAAFAGQIRALDVGTAAPNVGVVDLVPDALAGWRATFWSSFSTPQSGQVRFQRDGFEPVVMDVTVPSGLSTAEWPELPRDPGLYSATWLHAADALGNDDQLSVVVSTPVRARILHLGAPNPFLASVFADQQYQNAAEVPQPWSDNWDLVVTDGIAVPASYRGPQMWMGSVGSGGPVRSAGLVSGKVTTASEPGPLGRFLRWEDIEATDAQAMTLDPGVTELATIGGSVVVATWQVEGSPFLALGLDTRRSNLGLSVVWPVLLKTFLAQCVPQMGNPLADNLRVGLASRRAAGPGWKLTSGQTQNLQIRRTGTQLELVALAPGTFAWADGERTGTLQSRAANESDLTVKPLSGLARRPPSTQAVARSEIVPLARVLMVLALLVLVGEWLLWNGRQWSKSPRVLVLLRGSTLAVLVLGLVGLSLPLPTQSRSIAILVDISASLGPGLAEQQRQAADQVLAALSSDDRAALLTFAGQTSVISALVNPEAARRPLESAPLMGDEVSGAQTNLVQAVATAAQVLGGSSGDDHVYLVTDGRTTAGGDLEEVRRAVPGLKISAIALGRTLEGLEGRSLEVPSVARPGDAVSATWSVLASRAQTVTWALSVDGKAGAPQKAQLEAGLNRVEVALTAGGVGTHRLDLDVRDETGAPIPSAGASAVLTIGSPTSVLVVHGEGPRTAVSEALRIQGQQVTTTGVEGLPDADGGYVPYSALVLDNVTALSVSQAQEETLRRYVAGGGGLLVVGGDSSLGRGDYSSTGLEDLLPVHTDEGPKLRFSKSQILFVIDHSGSMSEDAGDTTKQMVATQGVSAALDDLIPQDEVGILEFDSSPDWVIPFTSLRQKGLIREALNNLRQGGGTDLAPALEEVLAGFREAGPQKRHVILLTDGNTGGERTLYLELAARLSAARISLTILGIGDDANDPLLSAMTEVTKGVYYRVQRDDVPRILHEETARVTRDFVQEGRYVPQRSVGPNSDRQPASLPAVRGYLITKARPEAEVLWSVPGSEGQNDPLFVQGRFGLGRVGVFTSDSGSRWLREWSGLETYNQFWGQAVRSVARSARDPGLQLQTTVDGSRTRLVVEARTSAGGLRTGASLTVQTSEGQIARLDETAPGRYEAEVDPGRSGLNQYTVADAVTGQQTWEWAWTPPSSELARGGADFAGLARLAQGTGGQIYALAAPLPPERRWTWSWGDLGNFWLLLALGLFFAELVIRSTMLGQASAAWAALKTWWERQRLAAGPIQRKAMPTRSTSEDERRVMEAYRTMAERSRRRPRNPE